MATVSVLIPNYNHAQFLGIALRALTAQSRPPEEIIVVDDCSTDDSLAVVDQFRPALPQLRTIRNPQNLGVNHSLNRALGEAQFSYVICTAADDWLEPRFIEKMTLAATAFPNVRLCVSEYVQYHVAEDRTVRHDGGSDLGFWYAGKALEFIGPTEFRKLLDRAFVWLPVNAALIHRDTLKAIGGFDPRLKWHADWFAAYTIGLRHGFAIVPEPLSVFRVAATTYSGVGMRNARRQRDVSLAIYDKLAQAEFRDIYIALRDHPVAFSPFFRQLAQGLATRPRGWAYLYCLLRWWINEARHGRRPGVLRDFVAARRGARRKQTPKLPHSG